MSRRMKMNKKSSRLLEVAENKEVEKRPREVTSRFFPATRRKDAILWQSKEGEEG